VLLAICDQPAPSAKYIERLVAAFRAGSMIVASTCGGSIGVPAVLHGDVFGALWALQGNEGARRILGACGAAMIDCPEGAIDIDPPDDAARIADGTSGACFWQTR
jgi:CTP:molybdopterin cytidylyltransferase MocA